MSPRPTVNGHEKGRRHGFDLALAELYADAEEKGADEAVRRWVAGLSVGNLQVAASPYGLTMARRHLAAIAAGERLTAEARAGGSR